MHTSLFDFALPEDRIALEPVVPRDAARLLVVRPGTTSTENGTGAEMPPPALEDSSVARLPDLLAPGDALVLNNTRVIPAALSGVRLRNGSVARVSLTLLERTGENRYWALARPAKRLAPGDALRFTPGGRVCALGELSATVERKGEGGAVLLAFTLTGAYLDEAIRLSGEMPLPPYIAARRPPAPRDRSDYQTVFAAREGAVAAPTAGLHFTPSLLARLKERGVSLHFVTLHTGAGTFLPVKAQDTKDHRMHAEEGIILPETAAALTAVRRQGGRIAAVGTTSLRLIETAAADNGEIRPFQGRTDLFIVPGYRFRAVDILMTNFHLPRSTLFMLVAAFSGLGAMKTAYAHAVAAGYRFYSYGDACLLFPAERRI